MRDDRLFRRSSLAFAGVTAKQEPGDFATLALVFECPKDTGPLPLRQAQDMLRRGDDVKRR